MLSCLFPSSRLCHSKDPDPKSGLHELDDKNTIWTYSVFISSVRAQRHFFSQNSQRKILIPNLEINFLFFTFLLKLLI